MFKVIVDNLGSYGHFILTIITTWFLIGRAIYLIWFIIGLVENVMFTRFLTRFIKEPRPREMVDDYDDYDERYGMPSLPISIAFYAVGFLYLMRNNIDHFFMIAMFIIGVMIYINLKNKSYSIVQMSAGGIMGVSMAYITHTISEVWVNMRSNWISTPVQNMYNISDIY